MERMVAEMKRTLPNIYGFYVDGELIHTGTSAELADKTGHSSEYITLLHRTPTKNKEVKLLYRQFYLYEVFDADGNVLFEGTSFECANFMNMTVEAFWQKEFNMRTGKLTGRRGGLLARKKGVCLR